MAARNGGVQSRMFVVRDTSWWSRLLQVSQLFQALHLLNLIPETPQPSVPSDHGLNLNLNLIVGHLVSFDGPVRSVSVSCLVTTSESRRMYGKLNGVDSQSELIMPITLVCILTIFCEQQRRFWSHALPRSRA